MTSNKNSILNAINESVGGVKQVSKDEVRSQVRKMQNSNALNIKMAHDLISNAPSHVGGGDLGTPEDVEPKKLGNLPKDTGNKPEDLRSLRSEYDYGAKKNFTEIL